jgi:uncharacterized protein HemY
MSVLGIQIPLVWAIALAPVVTVLILWVVKSLKRLPSDVKGYFTTVAIWIKS